MVLALALFALGILLIVKGGDWFVDAAGWLAEISGIPPVIIGATVVSLATTIPELLVSVLAATQGKVAMAVGNAVGSVNANIGLIMALSIIWAPGLFARRQLGIKAFLMVAACLLLLALSADGALSAVGSAVLLALFLIFVVENIRSAKLCLAEKTAAEYGSAPSSGDKNSVGGNLLKFFLGAAAIVVGARLLVDNGSALALCLGVSEAVIGVTMVAVGTSLPELVTTVSALVKRQAELSIGNIIGANIIDLTMILPVCAMFSEGTLPVCRQSVILDMPMTVVLVLLAALPPFICGRFRRSQGLLILLAYIAYMFLVTTGSSLIFI